MSKKISTILFLIITVPGFSQVLGNLTDYGWLTATPLPGGRWAHGTTSYRSGPLPDDTAYLVIVSGADASYANTLITSRLNTTSNVWTNLANIPTSRTQAQAYHYNGKIFFIGGYGGSFAPLNTVSIYTIATNSWSGGAPMLTAVGDYAGCQYNDSLIYIISGYNGAADVNTVQVYNAKTNTWSSATAFAGTAVGGARAGISGNNIIMAGGYSQVMAASLAKAWKGAINPLNPASITWTAIGDYPAGPSSRLAATGISGSQYVFFTGGDPNGLGTSVLNATWVYDVVNNGWWQATPKTVGVSNIENLVPLIKNDSVYLASTGGYNGTAVVTINEWLNVGKASIVLPLRLLDFSAVLKSGKTQLKWRVSEDGLGGRYTIQRSENAVVFTDFQNMNAGKTQREADYIFFDALPYQGYTYYRIKIISIDGGIIYSPIRSVFNNKQNTAGIVASLYPNPTTGPIKVELQSNMGRTMRVNVQISDISGHKVTSDIITLEASLQKSYMLKPGNYIIRMFTDDKKFNKTEKLVVF